MTIYDGINIIYRVMVLYFLGLTIWNVLTLKDIVKQIIGSIFAIMLALRILNIK